MKALFENFKLRYQTALAKLPNLGSHYAPVLARKPAISPLADQYHVSLTRRVRTKASAPHPIAPVTSGEGSLYKTAITD